MQMADGSLLMLSDDTAENDVTVEEAQSVSDFSDVNKMSFVQSNAEVSNSSTERLLETVLNNQQKMFEKIINIENGLLTLVNDISALQQYLPPP